MTDDLTDRLRTMAELYPVPKFRDTSLCAEAADRIDKLETETELCHSELVRALNRITKLETKLAEFRLDDDYDRHHR